MRKTSYLQLSENKDGQAFNFLVNCRHIEDKQLKQVISQNRINSYLKEKLIERVYIQDKTVYRLTEKGYRQYEKQLGGVHHRYHSTSISHDLRLSSKYLNLLLSGKAFSWRNEEDLKQERYNTLQGLLSCGRFEEYERLYSLSVPDCIYSVDGVEIGYDVITDNYSQTQIAMKMEYCHAYNIPFETSKI